MKKIGNILSYILIGILGVVGLITTIAIICIIVSLVSYSPSTGVEEILSSIFIPILIGVVIVVGSSIVSAIVGGITAIFLMMTADKELPGDENKVKRIALKCIAYGILIINVIRFAKFFT